MHTLEKKHNIKSKHVTISRSCEMERDLNPKQVLEGRKEITIIRLEVNNYQKQNKKKDKIYETMSWLFIKVNANDKILAKLTPKRLEKNLSLPILGI